MTHRRVVLLGRPGAGKGVQGRRLARALGVPHVSTGDLVRRAVAGPSKIASEVASLVADGELLPDELVLAMVELAVKPSCGAVLEGFPRSARQAAMLEQLWLPYEIDLAIMLDVPPIAAMTRLAARRFCPSCGTDLPSGAGSCPSCGGPFETRADDHLDVAARRLWLHDREEPSVEGWFERRGLLARVDGSGRVGEVFDRVIRHCRVPATAGPARADGRGLGYNP